MHGDECMRDLVRFFGRTESGVLVFDWIVYDSIGDELETTFQISFNGKSITCFPYVRESDLFSLWAHIADYFQTNLAKVFMLQLKGKTEYFNIVAILFGEMCEIMCSIPVTHQKFIKFENYFHDKMHFFNLTLAKFVWK